MADTLKVLHFDDDVFELERVAKLLAKDTIGRKFQVLSAVSADDFGTQLQIEKIDIAILDIHDQDQNAIGTKLMGQVKFAQPACVIIMRSNLDDTKTIRTCLAQGADDFISKRTDKGELCLRILNSYELCLAKRGVIAASSDQGVAPNKNTAVGGTLTRVKQRIPRILSSAISSVFISGESGTGKEVVASLFRAEIGTRAPYLALNCGAISGTLLESELFGHVKGAFTGAASDRRGLIESASGGWLFLDEVATLSMPAQVALLRVLENGELIRVGSNVAKHVDVKFLSATNQNIDTMIGAGQFRRDLWQRLNETTINLPPLAERKQEIPLLVEHFCRTMKGGPYEITQAALDVLSEYDWQEGNVRELRNCLRAMTELNSSKRLTPLSIPDRILAMIEASEGGGVRAGADEPDPILPPRNRLGTVSLSIPIDFTGPIQFDSLSNILLTEVISGIIREHGPISLRKLSALVGISRSTLSARIKALAETGVLSPAKIQQIMRLTDV